MEDLANKITLLRTEMNLTYDPTRRVELTKRLNILLLKQEIETIKKRIEQLKNT